MIQDQDLRAFVGEKLGLQEKAEGIGKAPTTDPFVASSGSLSVHAIGAVTQAKPDEEKQAGTAF